MTRRHVILATAGHVDHGKSALVKALTGTDPDRLPEEKARGITIELGFAHFELAHEPAATGQQEPAQYSLGVVDVPGHEDFVKNMVAGIGSIDLALLVVAADDGWMPQTEEHLQILEHLGVTRGVIALTKTDLTGDVAGKVSEIRRRLENSPLAGAPIVPTSAVTGRGLDDLRQAMLQVLAAAPAPRDIGRPRLAVDRAFTLKGLGTIVTGTLAEGGLRVGQEIAIQPLGRTTRIRSIQSHTRQVDEARPGMRTALNLPDIPLAAIGQEGVARGQWLVPPGTGTTSPVWDVVLKRSPRTGVVDGEPARELRSGVRVHVHHGSGCHPARLVLLETATLPAGATGLAQLRFDSPGFAVAGDRFVVRDWSGRTTLAGGRVLETAGERRKARATGHLVALRRLEAALDNPERWLEAALLNQDTVNLTTIPARSPFAETELGSASGRMLADGRILALGQSLVLKAHWTHWLETARSEISGFHRANPEKPGLPLADLRAKFATLDEAAFQGLAAALESTGHLRAGALIRSADHELKLPPQLEAAGRRLRRLLNEQPLEPPARKELAPDATAQTALRFLIDSGEAVDLGPELVLAAPAYRQAVALITRHLRQAGQATVSELRPVVGTTRRILIPLLEHLDRTHVTVRRGDVRMLK